MKRIYRFKNSDGVVWLCEGESCLKFKVLSF